tara:strand:+ start:633 stop:770 length:138 start_codon:yes stop_codon:yes gene_type:complete
MRVALITFKESWFFYVLARLRIAAGCCLDFKSTLESWVSDLHDKE